MGIWDFIVGHSDSILLVAGYLATKLGIRRANRVADWIKSYARRAFHEVLLAYQGRPVPSDSVIVEAAVRRIRAAARDFGWELTPAQLEIAEDLLRELVVELAAGEVKRSWSKIEASIQKTLDTLAKANAAGP